MERIKVMRASEQWVTSFQIGDKIDIPLIKFGMFTATAHKVTDEGALFIFDQIVTRMSMNSVDSNVGGFKKSDLYCWLQKDLLSSFPEELKGHIDELTIPTIGQIVGHTDEWDNEYMEPDEDEQLPLMKDVRNRIAAFNDEIEWYWLRNASKKKWSVSYFACVGRYGWTTHDSAPNSLGVRPEFWLKNL